MSDKYGWEDPLTTKGVAVRSAINMKEPIAHPCNCDHECCYGKDRALCFPCMKKIVEEHRAAKKLIAKEA